MADQDSGSKTEKPTPKKLRDARSEGNVAKSRDLTNTALLLLGGLLFWQLSANVGSELGQFTNLILTESALLSPGSLGVIGREATFLLLSISAKVVLPMAAFGILMIACLSC